MKRDYVGLTAIGIVVTTVSCLQAAELLVPSDYETIQAAVDAAAVGDTVHIAPGVYLEQVFIDKNLTLQGSPGTILRAFPNMDQAVGHWVPVVFVGHHLSNVVLKGLTFQGDQLAEEQAQDLMGVMFLDSGGAVDGCQFTGFRGSHGLGGVVTDAMALAVWNDLPDAPLYDILISENSIVDSYRGIRVIGTPDTNQVSLNVTIKNNVIRGIGPTEAFTEAVPFVGLELLVGITGTIAENTISDFSYSGSVSAFPIFFGILASSSTFPEYVPLGQMRFENNTLRDNDVHLSMIMSDQSEIVSNRFEGIGVADFYPGALFFSGQGVVVEGNHIVDAPLGITAWGDDPIFGLIPGVATDALILNNRFRDVAIPVSIQELALPTATETGNVKHPFPEPELEIVKTARLSWPDYYGDDYVLEGAPTPEGPWSEANVEVQQVDGEWRAIVTLSHGQRHFRLISQ